MTHFEEYKKQGAENARSKFGRNETIKQMVVSILNRNKGGDK